MPALSKTKWEAFCREYQIDRIGTQAAIRAGYSKKTAAETASRLLRNPQIQARIAELSEKILEKCDVTAERVMRELAAIAFSDPRKLFNERGELVPVHQLDDATAASIAGIEVETHWEGKGEDAVPIHVRKIRRWDKNTSLKVLAEHFKIVGDRDEGVNALANELADHLKRARERLKRGQARTAKR